MCNDYKKEVKGKTVMAKMRTKRVLKKGKQGASFYQGKKLLEA